MPPSSKAKTAETTEADAPETTEAPDAPESSQVGDAAPIEAPDDDEADESPNAYDVTATPDAAEEALQRAEVEHDAAQDTAPSGAETEDVHPTPIVGVVVEGKGEDAESDEPAAEDEGDVETPDAPAQEVKAPGAATIEPPADPEPEPEDESGPLPLTDAAAEKAKAAQASITREDGGDLDPEDMFGPVEVSGRRRVLYTLLQHTVIPPFDRVATTLLLARGQTVTAANADALSAKVQAERA